jgi:hypothetical protein
MSLPQIRDRLIRNGVVVRLGGGSATATKTVFFGPAFQEYSVDHSFETQRKLRLRFQAVLVNS